MQQILPGGMVGDPALEPVHEPDSPKVVATVGQCLGKCRYQIVAYNFGALDDAIVSMVEKAV